MNNQNKITLLIVIVLIVVAIFYLDSKKVHFTGGTASTTPLALVGNNTATTTNTADITQIRATKAGKYSPAVELVDPSGFINTPSAPSGGGAPISLKDYIGKDVVLIDFMTYSCINCQRTFPYITAFYSKYKDQGLVVIGIHTPEFDFEKDYNNVSAAMKRFGITYPVVMDNNYGTWNAYGNQYWPHEYLIDIDGYVIDSHIGEGGYTDTESAIKNALKERDMRLGIPVPSDLIDSTFVNPTGVITTINTNSPETYFGSNRNTYLGNGNQGQSGVQTFTPPAGGVSAIANNTFYFGGSWDVEGEYAQSTASGSSIAYNFSATHMYFVAGAVDQAKPIMAEVTMDGAPIPASLRGADIIVQNGKTYINVGVDRLYDLIDASTMVTHTIQITASGAGLQAYTFTFG